MSLIISDYKMPDGTGADLIEQVKGGGNNHNLNTILITGNIMEVSLVERELFDRILTKPFDFSQLFKIIQGFLN